MSKFHTIDFYRKKTNSYQLLPFRFSELTNDKIILTNLVGEHFITNRNVLNSLAHHELQNTSVEYKQLRSRHFLTDEYTEVGKELLSIKLRTKFNRLSEFTSLHMFVVSLRCEHSCPYCQVSRQSDDKLTFDMSEKTALKSLDLVFQSPSKNIKIEFQGGESLLNFKIIKFIVREAIGRNTDKNISFVIATNLAIIDEEILDFCKEYDIHISTSLDGPKDLHNKNRPRPGKDSYQRTIHGINQVRSKLGFDKVNALMTTTEASLARVKEIIDEYIHNQFNGIFLRPLSPYGFAIKTKKISEYNAKKWFEFYKEGINYIISLNKKGIKFREFYTSTILKKIFTFSDPGYVDLMSPSGIGIAGIVYNYDGDVYASDESRMLAEMGDKHFQIGNVNINSYDEIFLNENLLNALESSYTNSVPMCVDCAFEPYCGSDPVYHYATSADYLGKKYESDFCYRNMNVFKYIFNLMDEDKYVNDLFLSWTQ